MHFFLKCWTLDCSACLTLPYWGSLTKCRWFYRPHALHYLKSLFLPQNTKICHKYYDFAGCFENETGVMRTRFPALSSLRSRSAQLVQTTHFVNCYKYSVHYSLLLADPCQSADRTLKTIALNHPTVLILSTQSIAAFFAVNRTSSDVFILRLNCFVFPVRYELKLKFAGCSEYLQAWSVKVTIVESESCGHLNLIRHLNNL